MLGTPGLEVALQVGSHLDRAEGQNSPLPYCPWCFGCSSGHFWLFRLRRHMAKSCQAFHSPTPPSLSPQSCSQPVHAQPVFVLGTALTHVQHVALGLTGLQDVQEATSETCPGLFGCHPFPPQCQQHHTGWCHQQIC